MATRKRKGPVLIQNGPWTGCFQSWDVAPNPTSELYTALNVVFRNTQAGLAAQIRPGFQNLGQLGAADSSILATEAGVDITTELGGTDFLATDGHRTPQCVYQHTRVNGTNDPYVFVGGRMYEWNGDTTTPVFTDITPSTVSIDPSARIFCTSFTDRLIVNDGVYQPWTYNPATATATLIPYNTAASAWLAYGQPVVYGAKLFFIVQSVAGVSARTDFIWSEEAQPLVGYQQDGYDNAWEFTQTKADPLYALSPTNAALYIFRQDSISAVYGAVSTTFQTTATQDAISLTVGTTSPASVIQTGNHIWWLDRLGRPYRMLVGGQPDPIWKQLQDGVDSNIAASTLSTSSLERYGSAGFHMELGVVGFASWTITSGLPSSSFFLFDADSGTFSGAWGLNVAAPYMGAFGLLRDTNARQRFIILGTNTADVGGVVYCHRLIGSGGSTYYQDDSGQLFALVQARMLGDDPASEYIFDRVDVELAGDDTTGVGQSVQLTVGTQRTVPASQTNTSTALHLGTGHVAFGILQRGRSLFCQVTIQTDTTTRVIEGFNRILVTAFPDANDPGVP